MPAKPHKLLFIIGCYYPDAGGAETSCSRLAQKIVELGHEVTILTRFYEGLPAVEMEDGVRVCRYLKSWHLFELSYMLSTMSFLIGNRRRFDSVLCFGHYLFTPPTALFCRLTFR